MSTRDAASGKPAERRAKPRYRRRLPVRFGSEARMAGGVVVDISEAGLRIESPDAFPVNSIIQVFVQFPRHSVRLKARVAWAGGGNEGRSSAMGLTFTQPEPALAKAYKEWQAEVKQIARETTEDPDAGDDPGPADPEPAAASSPSPAPPEAPPPAPEPRSPVRRRLESPQGRTFDVVFEKDGGGWSVTAVQVPRQLGSGRNDFEGTYATYEAAERALRGFVRGQ
jgi:hypothetical protein